MMVNIKSGLSGTSAVPAISGHRSRDLGLTKPVILLALNISFQFASGTSVSNIFISVKTKFYKLLAFEWSPINLHVDTYYAEEIEHCVGIYWQ